MKSVIATSALVVMASAQLAYSPYAGLNRGVGLNRAGVRGAVRGAGFYGARTGFGGYGLNANVVRAAEYAEIGGVSNKLDDMILEAAIARSAPSPVAAAEEAPVVAKQNPMLMYSLLQSKKKEEQKRRQYGPDDGYDGSI